MKVLVCGDIHAGWGSLNTLINKQKPDIILQCGDYGWWPHFHNKLGLIRGKVFNQFGVKNFQNNKWTKIFWCGGNHENWDNLNCLSVDREVEVQDNIFYCPFGTLIELPNGETIMLVGGAKSTDKQWRTEGISWWADEEITQQEMDRLPDIDSVDIIVSHTIPRSWLQRFHHLLMPGRIDTNARIYDPSTFALDLILERYKPKKWFSGHFHIFLSRTIDGCEWTSLDMPNHNGHWWIELKTK